VEEKKQSVKVNILGEDYPIRGDAEKEYILRVGKYVDLKMREVAEKLSNKSPLRVAVLAAMNITDELFREREDKEKKISDVEERTQTLLDWIDSRVMQEDI
jgi:cell division protein ZapA